MVVYSIRYIVWINTNAENVWSTRIFIYLKDIKRAINVEQQKEDVMINIRTISITKREKNELKIALTEKIAGKMFALKIGMNLSTGFVIQVLNSMYYSKI